MIRRSLGVVMDIDFEKEYMAELGFKTERQEMNYKESD